jgi:hypothetical protein
MLRCGQMVLAQAMVSRELGRGVYAHPLAIARCEVWSREELGVESASSGLMLFVLQARLMWNDFLISRAVLQHILKL